MWCRRGRVEQQSGDRRLDVDVARVRIGGEQQRRLGDCRDSELQETETGVGRGENSQEVTPGSRA